MDEETKAALAARDAKIAALEAALLAAKPPAPVEGNVLSVRQMATRLGVDVSTVRRHATELGGRRRIELGGGCRGPWIFPSSTE
ncbi:MAG: hypothetical protein ACLP4V_25480 [Methylocella sp.]